MTEKEKTPMQRIKNGEGRPEDFSHCIYTPDDIFCTLCKSFIPQSLGDFSTHESQGEKIYFCGYCQRNHADLVKEAEEMMAEAKEADSEKV